MSPGGADAEAVYCTAYPGDSGTTVWLILAVAGDLLIHVSATGASPWLFK
jgi:hypothetical protein